MERIPVERLGQMFKLRAKKRKRRVCAQVGHIEAAQSVASAKSVVELFVGR